MGFLKIFKYLILLSAVFINIGCSSSYIKTDVFLDKNPYEMFGKMPSRNFYIPETVTDSLKLLWENEANGGFTNSSVSVYNKYVFVNDLSGRVFCFNINTGKEIGELKYKGAVYTTPVINKFYVIYVVIPEDKDQSELYYYDYSEGTVLAKEKIEGKVLTQIIKSKDGLIFNSDNGNIYKFGLYGKKNWETETNTASHSSPALSGNKIIFGNDKGEIICVGEKDGKILYRNKIGKSFYSGASISEGVAYIGNDDGYLYAINLTDGKIKWKFYTGARIVMTPVFNNESIFVGNLNGSLFSINKNTGEKNWSNNLPGILNASPLVTNNMLLTPDYMGKLVFIDINTGNIVKTLDLPGHAKLSPVLWQNKLFIGYDNYYLRAYEFVK